MIFFIIPPASTKLKGGILVSPCPSVCDHKSRIRSHNNTKKDTFLISHFNSGPCKDEDYTCKILETIQHPVKKDGKLDPVTSRHRRKREDFWMETLHTVYPYGLNNRHGRNKDPEDEEKAVKTSLKPRCKKKKTKQRFRRTSAIKDGGLIYKDITSMFGKEEDSNNVEYLNQAIKESHKIIPQLRKSEVKKIGELTLEDSYNDSHVPIRLLHMIIDLTRAKLQTGNTESNKEKKKENTKLAFIVRYQKVCRC